MFEYLMSPEQFLEIHRFFEAGGVVVWILLALSIVAMTVFMYKLLHLFVFYRLKHSKVQRSLALLAEHKPKECLLLSQRSRHPRMRLLTHTVKLLEMQKFEVSAVQTEAVRQARAIVLRLGSHLRVLEVIAMIAPLLGLFGTVLGMIAAFQGMEAAGARVDPSVLSGGIWVALLTTAVGLAVAIPLSLLHSWLDRLVEVESAAIEDDLQRIFFWAETRSVAHHAVTAESVAS